MTLAELQAFDRQRGEEYCNVCGCTDSHACVPRCFWVDVALCSNCGSAYPRDRHRAILAQMLLP